jgi:hypothetical protein
VLFLNLYIPIFKDEPDRKDANEVCVELSNGACFKDIKCIEKHPFVCEFGKKSKICVNFLFDLFVFISNRSKTMRTNTLQVSINVFVLKLTNSYVFKRCKSDFYYGGLGCG